MIKKLVVIMGIGFLALLGFGLFYWQSQQENPTTVPDQGTDFEERFDERQQGTITYVDLEGGFYGIVTENGEKLDPTNLPEGFKEDGLEVRFQAREKAGVAGIHMWGTIVELKELEGAE